MLCCIDFSRKVCTISFDFMSDACHTALVRCTRLIPDFFALSDVEHEGPEYLPVSQAWIKLRFNVTCTKMNCDVPHNQENVRFILTASTGDADEELFDTNNNG